MSRSGQNGPNLLMVICDPHLQLTMRHYTKTVGTSVVYILAVCTIRLALIGLAVSEIIPGPGHAQRETDKQPDKHTDTYLLSSKNVSGPKAISGQGCILIPHLPRRPHSEYIPTH